MDDGESLRQSKAQRPARFGLPRLTPLRVLSLLAGVVVVQMLPSLPPAWISLTIAGLASILLLVRSSSRAPTWFVLGLAWTLFRAHAALDARLPADLHGRDFDVVGTVRGLPEVQGRSSRFAFIIESAALDGQDVALQGLARLNWYNDAPTLKPCSRWRLRLRLRPPRGLVNPGGYDSERGAVQRGVIAVGYVRKAGENLPIDSATGPCIDQWRARIASAITHQLDGDPASALLRALAVGDQQGISQAQWQVLRATGIGHLIAISGLHVGMLAAFGALLARLLWKAFPTLTLRLPGPLFEAPVAMALATGYGLLAGMGVPTIRTLLMIAIALLARYTRRSMSVVQGLALAALAIVIWDPLAVLSAGFWLSFVGVAILLSMTQTSGGKRAWWHEIPRLQLILSLALLPMSVWFFGQGSLIGPLANLIAVPWVSFLVVPLTVAGSLLIVDLPALGGPVLQLADVLLKVIWYLMEWLAALPSAQVYFAAVPVWAFALALIGVGWMLMPRGVPLRMFGLVLLLPMLFPRQPDIANAQFEAWMFDVGQGLSMAVKTRNHTLLYDAGPRYPSGFDLGDAVVIPSLHALGIDHLERMIISHGDSDHAGGAEALHLAFPDAKITSGEPARLAVPASACHAGESWSWDEVSFRVVSAVGPSASESNDRSCVLLVSGQFGSLLLSGDVTSRVEPAIAEAIAQSNPGGPLVLSVPHHGSKTASSAGFLDAIHPKIALVSAGYRNHFGHPHPDVVARFAERDIGLFNTADSGYLHLRFGPDAEDLEQGRELRNGWWRMH